MKTSALILLASIAALTTSTHAQEAPIKDPRAKKKKVTWTFTPDEALPNVLILGDSISIGYTLQVRELLKGKANIYRPVNAQGTRPINCSGTLFGLQRSSAMLKAHKWDLIHFNWGLHDLKHVKKAGTHDKSNDPKSPRQASPEVYQEKLKEIVAALKKTEAKLIFATTTPVVPGTLNPLRTPQDPILYNGIAAQIMEENEIRVNDLHTYCLPHLQKWQLPKNVHFKAAGSQALAKKVAAVITEELAEK